jgi:lysophospholipase L1-like esterase
MALNVSDNFNDNSLDTAVWNETDSGTNVNEQNQRLEIVGNNAFNTNGVVTDDYVEGTYAVMDLSFTTPTPLTGNKHLLAGFAKSSTLAISGIQQLFLYIDPNQTNKLYVRYATGTNYDTGYTLVASTTYDLRIVWMRESQFVFIKGGSFGSDWFQVFERWNTVSPDGAYCQIQAYDSTVTYIVDDFSVTQARTMDYLIIDDAFTDNTFDTATMVKTESTTDNVIEQNTRLEITGNGAWNQNGIVSVAKSNREYMAMEIDITTPTSLGNSDDFMFGFCRHAKLTTSDVSRFMVLIDPSQANNIYIKNKTTDVATGETLAASTTYTFKLLWAGKTVALIVNGGAFSNEIIYSNNSYSYVPNLMHAHIQSYSTQTYIVDNLYVDKKTKTEVTDYTNGVHRYKMGEEWTGVGTALDSIGTAHSDPIGNAFTRPINGSNTKEGVFDGAGDSVDLQIASESIPTAGSISFFMNADTWSGNKSPFDNTANTGGNNYLLRLHETSGKIKFQTAGDTWNPSELDELDSNTVFETGKTYFIVITWNTSTKHKAIYVNGVLDAEKTIVGTMYFPSIFSSPMIGEGSLASWDFDGTIRDWTLWNVEISTSTMTTIMADDGHDWRVWTYEGVGIGDSIMGDAGGGNMVWEWLASYHLNSSWRDEHFGGETSTQIESRFVTDVIDTNCKAAALAAGTNDYFYDPPISLATTKSNILTMIDHCEKGGVDLWINELPPLEDRSGAGAPPSGLTKEQMQEWTKKINAILREVCVDRNIKFGASYQEMCENSTSQEDDLLLAYQADEVHPNATGRQLEADFLDLEIVPERKIRWGHTDFLSTPDDGSWDWWIGTGSITGDGDTGTLSLDSGEYMDSPVKPITDGANGSPIEIIPAVAAGTVLLKYRFSASNFNRNDAATWISYSSPITLPNQYNFFQMRIEHLTGTPAQVSDVLIRFGPEVAILIKPISVLAAVPFINNRNFLRRI